MFTATFTHNSKIHILATSRKNIPAAKSHGLKILPVTHCSPRIKSQKRSNPDIPLDRVGEGTQLGCHPEEAAAAQ